MIDQFKELLKEIQEDSSDYAKERAEMLSEYIQQYSNGELTEKQFLKYTSLLEKLDSIHRSSTEIKAKAAIQKSVNLAKELLAKLI